MLERDYRHNLLDHQQTNTFCSEFPRQRIVEDKQDLEDGKCECYVHARHTLQIRNRDADALLRLLGGLADAGQDLGCIGGHRSKQKTHLEGAYARDNP